jgi:hypothetical protein
LRSIDLFCGCKDENNFSIVPNLLQQILKFFIA